FRTILSVFTFKLQKGVTFHDGEPYNAGAQKFAYERMMAMNEGPAYMLNDYVETIEAPDELTLKLTLKKPVATYMQYLAGFWGPSAALSPKAVKDHATDQDKWAKDWFNSNAVGTGPYKLDEYVPKVQYVISKYEDYWRGWDGQHFDKVIHRIIPEIPTERLLLEKGDIDVMIESIPATDYKALEGKPGIELVKTESMVLNVIQLNNQKAPTSDINIRKGLVYAFDYDAVINNIYGGLAIRNGTTYPKGYEGYRSDIELPKKDLEKAKKYFADAGSSSGLELEMFYLEGLEIDRRIGEMFQADLSTIGVKLSLRPIAQAALFEMQAKPDTGAQMVIFPWAPDNRDGYSIANILWNSKGGVNWCFYNKPEMDDLLSKVQGEADKAKRTQLYEQIDKMVRDDAAWIMVAQEVHGTAWHDYIKGARPDPLWYWGVRPYDVYRG
ncbi:MAG: ABC transporter substrate-binding protein, partial [Chloroflexi bacterium]|nr:ABC transporter substrate-binding protein [Chloroflexota bacterium]